MIAKPTNQLTNNQLTYQPVIGLEVHVELNTKTKMFCRCSADYFGQPPNTHTCPVCLGLPGALPMTNIQAIESCIKIGLALNCSINAHSYFERKNYFYPDLAKGFQTSQLIYPVAVKGWIDVEGEEGKIIRIRINRAHQEEDTAKLTHSGTQTLIDFNRSGVPLVEIVTEPDFTDTVQIKDYAKKLQQIFRYLGVSNADMERGDMRLEANVSVRHVGQTTLPPYRVELKNINSFRFMEQAVKYEIDRQIRALENGEKLSQETRGWNEDKKYTYVQRSKEQARDYRYFPEPDLPELELDPSRVEEIKASLPELPWQRINRYQHDYNLPRSTAISLASTYQMSSLFEETIKISAQNNISKRDIANVIVNRKLESTSTNPTDVKNMIISRNSGILSDESEIERIATKVLKENAPLVELYKRGKTTIIQALIGQAMRKTGGKADVNILKQILEKLLSQEKL